MVSIPLMVDDTDLGIDWTIKNIAQYGGDPRNIVIVGQSAGGHLACMAIFRKAQTKITRENSSASRDGLLRAANIMERKRTTEEENPNVGWVASDIRGFATISSPVCLGSAITKSFRRQGFDD